MGNFIKWIGGTLGWAAGGPIGAIIGFAIGSLIDTMQTGTPTFREYRRTDFNRPQTTRNDFYISLLTLSALVMKADDKVMRSELNFVKKFLTQQFGETEAGRQLQLLRQILEQEFEPEGVAQQVRHYMEYPSRLQLLHYLYGVAAADGYVSPPEAEMISRIALGMGIRAADASSVQAMFVKDTGAAYRILELQTNSTDDEVKVAYRKMAMKYHPDKVAHLGEEVQKAANAKFRELNEAYETIKKERGMA